MKALVCCVQAPWPPMSGADLRCWQTLQLLRECAQVGLFALAGNAQSPPGLKMAVWCVSSSAEKPLDQAGWMKRDGGLPSDAYYDERSVATLRRLLEEFAPDVVVLDGLWMHGYEKIARSCGARLILNAHNVEAAVARELAEHEMHPPSRLQRRVFATRVARLETELANRMDQIWVCSPEDRQQFLEPSAMRTPIYIVPNAIEVERYRGAAVNCPVEWEGLEGPFFLFTGTFNYAPNQRAADFLIRKVFPDLSQAYLESRLVLVGSNPTPQMLAAAGEDQRIIVTGRVPETISYLRHSSMMLVPLFEGGGTRFKILEAFAAGLPVVSTAKGAEGLGAEAGKDFLLAEEPAAFLNAIAELHHHPNRRQGVVQSAAELVERFSWDAVRQTVTRALRELES
jgi:glycosyltransferase involved in cell wall biosynthesis